MTSQSPRIYTYKITFEEVPYYYYGVHKEKVFGEYYIGSPKTHKWCWNFYTPKKQILEFFEFSDECWLEANLVEDRLIKPVFNIDKWCLNESCGGIISLETRKIGGKKAKELGLGFHGRTKEQMTEDGKKGGKKGGKKIKENKIAIFGLTPEQLGENGKIGGKKAKELGVGIHGRTKEQMSEDGKKGGKKGSKKTNTQKWMCLETGYVSTSAGLSNYQRAKGIDTYKRKRID